MAFADETVTDIYRDFECGWSARQQTAADIADRVQHLARRLGAIDPAYGRIRPSPGMRKFRSGDRGPILDMTPAELAELIDRRGRFDPPRYPAPVSPTGYRVLYRNDLMGLDPSHFSVSIRAGEYGPGWVENRVEVWPQTDHPLWLDPERALQLLDAMVEIWEPEWASACASMLNPSSPGEEITSRVRPWLAWTAKPLQPRPNPPYGRPYPYPFPLDDAGPPTEVRPWHGGELSIWP
jgi:hypothetical protein